MDRIPGHGGNGLGFYDIGVFGGHVNALVDGTSASDIGIELGIANHRAGPVPVHGDSRQQRDRSDPTLRAKSAVQKVVPQHQLAARSTAGDRPRGPAIGRRAHGGFGESSRQRWRRLWNRRRNLDQRLQNRHLSGFRIQGPDVRVREDDRYATLVAALLVHEGNPQRGLATKRKRRFRLGVQVDHRGQIAASGVERPDGGRGGAIIRIVDRYQVGPARRHGDRRRIRGHVHRAVDCVVG